MDRSAQTVTKKRRILAQVVASAGCWLWTGGRFGNGYGRLSVGNASRGAQRVAYEAFVGPIPAGLSVCHRCDVKRCVNPSHLFLGTTADNQADKVRKCRQARGSANGGGNKLKESDIPRMRARYSQGWTKAAIARAFGVSKTHVGRILGGHNWSHI